MSTLELIDAICFKILVPAKTLLVFPEYLAKDSVNVLQETLLKSLIKIQSSIFVNVCSLFAEGSLCAADRCR